MNTTCLPTDQQLIERYLQGDRESMGILYQRYSEKVYAKCLSFMKNADEAYDLTQDILLKSFEKMKTFRGTASFSTWLYSITVNHCTEVLRKKKNKHYTDIDTCYHLEEEASEDIDVLMEQELQFEQVKTLLDGMPELDRQLLVLKYEQKKSIKELQEMFGLGASAIKMRLSRARLKVNQSYQQHYPSFKPAA